MRLVVLGLLVLAAPAHAEMYKCVDARGATSYADQPGPGCKPAAIRASPPISGQIGERHDDFAAQDAQFRRRQIEQAARGEGERRALEQRCSRLRREYGSLTSGIRIATVNARGERVFMDDATRDERIASVREELRGCP